MYFQKRSPSLRSIIGGKSLRQDERHNKFWTNPWTYISLFIGTAIVGGTVIYDIKQQRIVSIFATDISLSATFDPKIGKDICLSHVQQLIHQDESIGLAYADTTEPLWKGEVTSTAKLMGYCKLSNIKEQAKRVGKIVELHCPES
ncbi:MAG: hypothetical protein HC921_21035 [Synechococcaceae cyanobacterium SM2_3_1]|nr:hypothetical protein [Synechococcaceae cyanobacterium SM2_3_1]